MYQPLPLALPAKLVDLHRIDLTALYSKGWGVEAYDVAAAPNGEVYALYGVHRHLDRRSDDVQDPAVADFAYRILTRYSGTGDVLASAYWRSRYLDGATVAEGGDMSLCVLPDGTLAVSALPDRTTLITSDLSRVAATYATREWRNAFDEFTPGESFATSISVTPSGRLLCTVAEFGVWKYGSHLTNLVGVADGALSAASKPVIEALVSLDPQPDHQREIDLRAHVFYQGAPVGLAHRPRPALTEQVPDEDLFAPWRDSRLKRAVALADDLFVVPWYGKTYRGGSRGRPFVFALVDDRGKMTGRLQGMDNWDDSPFTGFCFGLAADAYRGFAFHLNRYGLYAWDRTGNLRAKLDTGSGAFKPLIHFTLTACSPAGELLLVHNKQHLVLRLPVPDDLNDLAAAVEQALSGYARQRTVLKKRWAPVNWHWTQADAPLQHF
ncbi:hypothetical protein ACFWYW_48965 [Nonomuraea sp. NPDC059023]|uniref:hypothetical protein n=1 Tax=unclassified Nonomuraea TaxID=2593643 RepID=UPI0036C1A4AC